MADPTFRANVLVCSGTGCTSSGSKPLIDSLRAEIYRRGLDQEVRVVETGCRGFCAMGPVIVIYPEGIFYTRVQASDVPDLVEETLVKGRIVERLTYTEPSTHQAVPHYKDIPFYGKQLRLCLRNCGLINPESIDEYIARGGYEALGKALSEMTPLQVIDEVKRSGLRGRGGAGFLVGLKWELAQKAPGTQKYVVCNADEGDPGAFMDRSILEGDPHSVLEGMTIAAYSIGASEGYIYCRAEYPLAIERLMIAIKQAHEYGLMGKNILGSDFSFEIKVKEGAGAFVCGEETALIASIEGKRGEPRPRPPFPAVSGLWGKPTNNNNVKSYAIVPQIIANGASWFSSIGSPKSPGTAIFALTGKVNNTGLVEVPMGITVGEIVFDIGNGIPKNKQFKAVQTGGPLGGCIPASGLNLHVDFDALKEAGAVMGSGGMIVVDEDTCMVEFSKFFLTFATAESCGKCVPCRVGGKRMLEVLNRITSGQGVMEDIPLIEELAAGMMNNSLCALGQLTPGPVLSALRYFREEFETHILEHRCPAGACKELVRAPCANACPAGVDVPSYLSLVSEGKYAEGLAIHRKRNPFALVCGRVCPAYCEKRCRRGDLDQPIAIRQVKRFMADQELKAPWNPPQLEPAKDKKVAVIGAGPAGLTAALRLAQWGYQVVVFDALPVAGGMMAVGIPEYRLPRDILQAEVDNIRRAGVEIKLNARLGRDFSIDDLMDRDQFSSVIIAIGAQQSRSLRIEGEDKAGVWGGTDFLRRVALGDKPDLTGKRVAVVGGGNTAIDAARTALRLGAATVTLVYRRTREEMPAQALEVHEAEEEGVKMLFLVNPSKIIGGDKVEGLELVMQDLGDFDDSARRRPIPIAGSEFVLPVDIILPAIGQSSDITCADKCGVTFNRNTTVQVDRQLGTSRPGVFAAGDVVLGPATVVEAVAQGNKVAMMVDEYLQQSGAVDKTNWLAYDNLPNVYNMEAYATAVRAEMAVQNPEVRKHNWHEVELGFKADSCREECKRCLRCDIDK
ncbi:MAG: FAD-dependent oxidoreductase [Chloroflexi bacterium]|nr:FAD-dependent oxidoreductase [Chloroflexota bacterium]